ncbi:MAG: hypothetical protein JWQ11_2023 [Rhizobacter sp.]|nr:hypothetical protein [Rhizobacter sp.]
MPNTLLPRLSTAALAAYVALACLGLDARAADDAQPWMGTPEGAFMTRLEAIVPPCKRLYDRDTNYRNQEGPQEDRPATTKCIDDGQKSGKDQLDLVSANSAFKLDLNTVHMKWSAWLNSVSASSTSKTPAARQAYDFAAGQLKAKLNAAKP